MTISAMWMHGTALAVESPEHLASNGRFGWGGDLQVQPGQSTWMHIQVPTPVLVGGVQARLLRAFFLFETFGGRFDELHVFDGGSKVHEFKGLNLSGKHRAGVDSANRFDLATPHTVFFGVGLSAHFTASIGIDSPIPPTRVIVSAAGGDFET